MKYVCALGLGAGWWNVGLVQGVEKGKCGRVEISRKIGKFLIKGGRKKSLNQPLKRKNADRDEGLLSKDLVWGEVWGR